MPLGLHTANLNFETIREIGQQGRNSQVFLAHDKQLDGNIVVKKILKANIPNTVDYYNEAKVLYMSAHPYVVQVNYGCEDADSIYIAMPFYKNGSLKTLIGTKFLTIREVIRYSIQFLSGLNNIHSKKLIHFDIKPDNILVSDSDEALLSDFGLSKAMNLLGFASPNGVYARSIPPEFFLQTANTYHFDIYQAGLTIYRLLNGEEHFNNQFTFATRQEYTDAIQAGQFPDRNSYLNHIPLKLQRIVNRAIEVDANNRHTNVLELINELSSVVENLDWRYSKTGNIEQWVKELPDKEYIVNLEKNGNNRIINTTKTMKATGRTTRVTDHCDNNLTANNVSSKLRKAFKEI